MPDVIEQQKRSSRVRFKHPVRVVTLDGQQRVIRTLTANVSHQGMFLRMPQPLPMGTRVALSLEAGGRALALAQAQVVWARINESHLPGRFPGCGVRFTGFLHPRANELVDYLVDNLDRGRPLTAAPAPKTVVQRWAPRVALGLAGVLLLAGAISFLPSVLDGEFDDDEGEATAPTTPQSVASSRSAAKEKTTSLDPDFLAAASQLEEEQARAPAADTASPNANLVVGQAKGPNGSLAVTAEEPRAASTESSAPNARTVNRDNLVEGARVDASATPTAETVSPAEPPRSSRVVTGVAEDNGEQTTPTTATELPISPAAASLRADANTEPPRGARIATAELPASNAGPIAPPMRSAESPGSLRPAIAEPSTPPALQGDDRVAPVSGAAAKSKPRDTSETAVRQPTSADPSTRAPAPAKAGDKAAAGSLRLNSGASEHLTWTGNSTSLRLNPGAPVLRAFVLAAPDRAVFDLDGSAPKRSFQLDTDMPHASRVRVGKQGKGTRVVVDLTATPTQVKAVDGSLVLDF